MTDILLSIKPEYAEIILAGEKTVELRRALPSRFGFADKAFLYATSPVRAVVGRIYAGYSGYADCESYRRIGLEATCLTKEQFDDYCRGRTDIGVISIVQEAQFKPYRYEKPLALADFGIKKAPQNFCYIERTAR